MAKRQWKNIKLFGGMIEDDGELAPAGGELARRCGAPCHRVMRAQVLQGARSRQAQPLVLKLTDRQSNSILHCASCYGFKYVTFYLFYTCRFSYCLNQLKSHVEILVGYQNMSQRAQY